MTATERSPLPRPVTAGDQYLAAVLAALVELTGEVRELRQVLEPKELVPPETSETLEPLREAPVVATRGEPEGEAPAKEPQSKATGKRGRRPRKGR